MFFIFYWLVHLIAKEVPFLCIPILWLQHEINLTQYFTALLFYCQIEHSVNSLLYHKLMIILFFLARKAWVQDCVLTTLWGKILIASSECGWSGLRPSYRLQPLNLVAIEPDDLHSLHNDHHSLCHIWLTAVGINAMSLCFCPLKPGFLNCV